MDLAETSPFRTQLCRATEQDYLTEGVLAGLEEEASISCSSDGGVLVAPFLQNAWILCRPRWSVTHWPFCDVNVARNVLAGRTYPPSGRAFGGLATGMHGRAQGLLVCAYVSRSLQERHV